MEQKKFSLSELLRIIIVVAAACLVHGVMQGVHDNYGIMLNGLLSETGLGYDEISLCIGAGALVYGFAQPFLGMLALRRSNAFVVLLGIAFSVTGLLITPLCRSLITLFIFFGLVLPFGTTGLCFGIVMGLITPVLGEKRAAIVSGLVQASAGVGDALMSPTLQAMISGFGIRTAMSVFAIPFLIMIPIAIWLGKLNKTAAAEKKSEDAEPPSLKNMIFSALRDRDYRLVLAAFATCGFNMSIIESHLFSQFLSYGISETVASLTLTVYGIATMTGAAGAGFLCAKCRMKNVLGSVYAVRVLVSIGFLLLPKSPAFAFAATALLGLSGDSTVIPTSGIISRRFGAEKMAVLYGFTLIGHQIGAFASSYLGGIFVKYGLGYSPLWIVNMCLAAFASIASYSVKGDKE